MGTSGSEIQLKKSSIAAHILLRICLAVLFLHWTPHAGAIRTGQLNVSNSSGVDEYYSYNSILAGKDNGLYEQSNDGIQPGGMSSGDAEMVQPFDVPQYDSKERYPRIVSNLSSGSCDVHRDLPYTQDLAHYKPDGMPIFHVTFTNACLVCPIFAIHIMCGEFTSATVLNPNVFRRLGPNDCLLLNGNELGAQQTIAFEYSSTFAYPMLVGRASTLC